MVAGDSIGIGCCEFRKLGTFVGPLVSRTIQSGLEHTLIAQSAGSTMNCKLLIVDCNDHLTVEPKRLAHFANSARALRYRFMPRRATVIAFSKSGSWRVSM